MSCRQISRPKQPLSPAEMCMLQLGADCDMWLEKGTPRLIAVLLVAAGWAVAQLLRLTATDERFQLQMSWRPKVSRQPPPSNAQPARGGGSVPQVSDPQAAQTAEALASMSTPGARAYRIGPLDVLDISVFQAPELSKTVEVADNGTIDLPLLGETPAAGKTAHELQRDLNSRLGAKYLQNPQVTVMVKEFNSNRVTVSGAVKSPGVFPYKGETLLQFVTMAGGLAPESNSMVLVLRTE